MSTTEMTTPAEHWPVACECIAAGSPADASVHLVALVDLLAEAFVARITANDNLAPQAEG
jgi:hypothetical protein